MSLSPDGRTLAIAAGDRHDKDGVEIVDVATHRRRTSLPETETVTDLARFTPDGRFIVGGSWKGWARLWSTKTWRPATRVFTGHAGRVEWQSTSPDGRTLATGGPDGAIRLWDLRTQQPLGAPLPALPNHDAVPQFTPDGTLPVRPHRRRARLPLGHAPHLMGAPRLRGRRPHAHPDRVERRTARARLQAGVHALTRPWARKAPASCSTRDQRFPADHDRPRHRRQRLPEPVTAVDNQHRSGHEARRVARQVDDRRPISAGSA